MGSLSVGRAGATSHHAFCPIGKWAVVSLFITLGSTRTSQIWHQYSQLAFGKNGASLQRHLRALEHQSLAELDGFATTTGFGHIGVAELEP